MKEVKYINIYCTTKYYSLPHTHTPTPTHGSKVPPHQDTLYTRSPPDPLMFSTLTWTHNLKDHLDFNSPYCVKIYSR